MCSQGKPATSLSRSARTWGRRAQALAAHAHAGVTLSGVPEPEGPVREGGRRLQGQEAQGNRCQWVPSVRWLVMTYVTEPGSPTSHMGTVWSVQVVRGFKVEQVGTL